MHFSEQRFAPSTQPALDLISLAMLAPATARHNIRSLLTANPNYFGGLTEVSLKTILNIRRDTTYESLERIEYDSLLKQLHATLHIKRLNSFSSESQANSSCEYVRFYLSNDRGFTWSDLGLRATDLLDVTGSNPRSCTISVNLGPSYELDFRRGQVNVRAILSWNAPPPSDFPDWTPVWGNVMNKEIRFPGRFIAHRPNFAVCGMETR